jgi:hypothetical protein
MRCQVRRNRIRRWMVEMWLIKILYGMTLQDTIIEVDNVRVDVVTRHEVQSKWYQLLRSAPYTDDGNVKSKNIEVKIGVAVRKKRMV